MGRIRNEIAPGDEEGRRKVLDAFFGRTGPRRMAPSATKYHAEASWVGSIRFQSKREAKTYQKLMALWKGGKLRFPPLRQVPFHLPGGVRYLLDFLVQELDGRVRFLDAKGFRTDKYKLKKAQVEDLYPGVKIEEV